MIVFSIHAAAAPTQAADTVHHQLNDFIYKSTNSNDVIITGGLSAA
jgi:hypothetical protein